MWAGGTKRVTMFPMKHAEAEGLGLGHLQKSWNGMWEGVSDPLMNPSSKSQSGKWQYSSAAICQGPFLKTLEYGMTAGALRLMYNRTLPVSLFPGNHCRWMDLSSSKYQQTLNRCDFRAISLKTLCACGERSAASLEPSCHWMDSKQHNNSLQADTWGRHSSDSLGSVGGNGFI